MDIVTDKAIGTDDQNDPEHKVNYYMCTNYHISSDAVTYENTDFWSPVIDTTKPIKTPLVLADKIQADFIDVDDLHVKHLDGANGTFKGTFDAQATVIDQYDERYKHKLNLNAEGLELSAVYDADQSAESVTILPYADPDAYDRGGLVAITAGYHGSCALYIGCGRVEGFNQGVEVVTDNMAPHYNISANIHTFILNVTSDITLH